MGQRAAVRSLLATPREGRFAWLAPRRGEIRGYLDGIRGYFDGPWGARGGCGTAFPPRGRFGPVRLNRESLPPELKTVLPR